MSNLINPDISVRNYAHIGDAVYEVFVREKTILLTQNAKKMHRLTVSVVNAEFQTEILEFLVPFLTESEQEIVRRARNIPVTTARRVNQKVHRPATAFEALIGYLHTNDKARLQEIFTVLSSKIDEAIRHCAEKI